MSTIASKEDCAAFVGTAQLYSRESDLCSSALLAGFAGGSLGLDFVSFHCLDGGEFLAQEGREVRGLGLGDNFFEDGICRNWSQPALYPCAFCRQHPKPMGTSSSPECYEPLFWAPQASHVRTFFSSPLEAGRRLPQPVQNTKDPIALMVSEVLSSRRRIWWQ